MQFTKIMFALAAMAAGSVMAAVPVGQIGISSGASASKGNVKLALANRCPGQLGEYTDGTTNVSTYVCATAGSFANPNAPTAAEYAALTPVAFTGTIAAGFTPAGIAEVRVNVGGGSFTSVCQLAGWPGSTKCPAADTYKDPADAAVPATKKAPPAGSFVLGGLTDVEPTAFSPDVRLGVANPPVVQNALFGQTFGVAVSDDLYAAMFTDQLASGVVAAGCVVGDTARPECVPVIGKAQMASIMSGDSNNDAYDKGANFLAPSLTNPTTLRYARRVDTSGTQASAQNYFLGTNCLAGSAITVVPEGASLAAGGTPVGAAMIVYGTGSTGNARGVLNLPTPNYAIGVLSLENKQAESWKWVRVGGVGAFTNATPELSGANTATALAGLYDFWYLSRIARPNNAGAANFWNSVITGLGTVPAGTTAGLFRTSETQFSKGASNSCVPVRSN